MNPIKKEILNLEIQNDYSYNFEIPESGTYLVEIIASAKSWRQNFKSLKSFFQDDDLAVKIDNIEFSKLNGKKRLFDSEAAWNGNNLTDKESWKKCYEISKEILSNNAVNPTEATHFHGIGVDRDDFEKDIVPNGKFIKKIGDTYFYWSPN